MSEKVTKLVYTEPQKFDPNLVTITFGRLYLFVNGVVEHNVSVDV